MELRHRLHEGAVSSPGPEQATPAALHRVHCRCWTATVRLSTGGGSWPSCVCCE